jgi:hypothetical protein
VELKIVESISDETVRRVLKKQPPWQKQQWIGQITADFSGAWKMCWTCTPNLIVCFDERPYQLVRMSRMEPGRPQRVDYEYERQGC